MKELILASKSPRRNEILNKAGFKFIIKESDYDEKLKNKNFSYDKIELLAKNKAFGALSHIEKPSYIISADTVVVLDSLILTKPRDKEDAINSLKKLSNRTHCVVTSICVLDSQTKKFVINSTTTQVEFNNLTNEMIENYVTKYNPIDKAGSYGIQELPKDFVKSINGDIENVIGISSNSTQIAISNLEQILKQSQEKSSYLQD